MSVTVPASLFQLEKYDSADGAYIYTLSTVEEYRGRGIATEIMRRLLEKALERRDEVYIVTDPGLSEFYSDRGFEELFETASYRSGRWDGIF
ncbi:MAG: GNAT family N-acetyltransferase [Candidatus Nanohaloarchaea archaeon]